MAYSLNPSSDNCYEGTTCLVNKLGIRDEKKLSEIEAQIEKQFDVFADAVNAEDTELARETSDTLSQMVETRNQKCKQLK